MNKMIMLIILVSIMIVSAAGIDQLDLPIDITSPTSHPTQYSSSSTIVPSLPPSIAPTTIAPSFMPSASPTFAPSQQPTAAPTKIPSTSPSAAPTADPSAIPTAAPSADPSFVPTQRPSRDRPTSHPSSQPISHPPSSQPSGSPSVCPTSKPSSLPQSRPTSSPSSYPSSRPSSRPVSSVPSSRPSVVPSCSPSARPTSDPSTQPSSEPSQSPTSVPSSKPTTQPSSFDEDREYTCGTNFSCESNSFDTCSFFTGNITFVCQNQNTACTVHAGDFSVGPNTMLKVTGGCELLVMASRNISVLGNSVLSVSFELLYIALILSHILLHIILGNKHQFRGQRKYPHQRKSEYKWSGSGFWSWCSSHTRCWSGWVLWRLRWQFTMLKYHVCKSFGADWQHCRHSQPLFAID